MGDSELCYLGATRILRAFRERSLSPVELLDALIARAERLEPSLRAFADTYYEEARAAARAAEARYAGAGEAPRALEGLPLAVKDDTAMAGRRTTHGSLIHAEHVDAHTNPSVERLLGAGAIVHARTTCPEFCWAWVCNSRIHGVTRNPWDPRCTPGGSSGGAAAALAAGTTPLATGTDSGGSIRMPSAMCGVVGYKPPYGRNPADPDTSFDFYNHIGPMARSVADCALAQNWMSGPHPADHASVRERVEIPETLEGIRGLRVAYSYDLGFHRICEDVRRNTRDALEALREGGAETAEVAIGWGAEATRLAGCWGDHLHFDRFERALRDHPELVCEETRFFADQCEKITQHDFRESLIGAGRLWREHMAPLFERFDALVCPTVAVSQVPAELEPWQELEIEGVPVRPDGSWVMTMIFNMWSRCPVLAVPSGVSRGGLPTGIQIAGRPFDDVTVFRLGAALERERGWLDWSRRHPPLE